MPRLPDTLLAACLGDPRTPLSSDAERLCGLDHDAARTQLAALKPWLVEQQQLLWARKQEALLVWLQGPDCAGKDGAIRQVFSGLNPMGLTVHNFRQPSVAERAEGFLERYRRCLPAPGEIVLFNRTPYEGVACDLFDGFCAVAEIPARLAQLAAFEDQLAGRGIRLLKVYLQISRTEQKARLRKRLLDPRKHWKLCAADLDAHRQFQAREAHWAGILAASHRPPAPWQLIPANHKWLRDLLLASLLVREFERLDQHWPSPPLPFGLDELERA
ncbi:polyphosphate kinase 2 family protein [Geopseudomonas aromaticivorans]